VGARVGEFAINESDHALIKCNREQGTAFSYKYLDGRDESDSDRKSKNFKLKSLILAQIERWRHA
jgi:hypothetical protein